VFALSAFIAVLGGCGADASGPGGCPPPVILTSEAAPNPHNVIAAAVDVRTTATDSVAVRYRGAGAVEGSATPALAVVGDQVTVAVLGLLPETPYELRAVAFGACGVATGSAVSFHTGALPTDLPRFSAGGPNPSPGFVVFAAATYGLAIDNSGRVVWYHRFDIGPGLNFQPQPNGRYVARPPSPLPTAPWIEIDPSNRTTRTLHCLAGLTPRFHDMLALPDGSYWLLCDEARVLDLSALGGLPSARVIGTGVQHIGANGELRFQWSPFDHIPIEGLSDDEKRSAEINWTHGNALELDRDGKLLLSFRNLSQVVKIDPADGRLVWRLGGARDDFAFEDGARPPFSRQHGVRTAGAGHILLLDNHGEPGGSRAERYEVDETARRLRLVGAYGPEPGVTAQVGGTVQSLPGGRTLVSFGSGGRVEEYDAAGNVVWRIGGSPGYVFRAQRILSLYQPGVGLPR
jgi:hypothetical protein